MLETFGQYISYMVVQITKPKVMCVHITKKVVRLINKNLLNHQQNRRPPPELIDSSP